MPTQSEVAGHFVLQQGTNAWQPLLAESTAYFKALAENNETEVVRCLQQQPELIDAQLTLLYWGADPASPSAAAKASVNVKHRTALMVAAQCGSADVIRLLLQLGADPSVKSSDDGMTALQVAHTVETCNSTLVAEMLAAKPQANTAESPVLSAHASAGAPPRSSGSDTAFEALRLAQGSQEGRISETTATSEPQFTHDAGAFVYSVSELTRPEFAADDFRMFHFKVSRCCKKYAHDWRACPFAHPTENARRRDPRTFKYCAAACPDYKQGFCIRGDACPFAHGVFEGWLHPSRYRTQLCKDGANCHRAVCFFAHSLNELRSPTYTWTPSPEEMSAAGVVSPPVIVPIVGAAQTPPKNDGGASASNNVQSVSDAIDGFQGDEHTHSVDQAVPLSGSGRLIRIGTCDSEENAQRPESGHTSANNSVVLDQALHAASDSQHESWPDSAVSGSSLSAPLVGFAPRMSNAFARRHGLNPKDNAMINLQKLALQTQAAAASSHSMPLTQISMPYGGIGGGGSKMSSGRNSANSNGSGGKVGLHGSGMAPQYTMGPARSSSNANSMPLSYVGMQQQQFDPMAAAQQQQGSRQQQQQQQQAGRQRTQLWAPQQQQGVNNSLANALGANFHLGGGRQGPASAPLGPQISAGTYMQHAKPGQQQQGGMGGMGGFMGGYPGQPGAAGPYGGQVSIDHHATMLALNQSLLALNLQQQQQQQQMLPGLYTSIQGMDGAYAMPPDM